MLISTYSEMLWIINSARVWQYIVRAVIQVLVRVRECREIFNNFFTDQQFARLHEKSLFEIGMLHVLMSHFWMQNKKILPSWGQGEMRRSTKIRHISKKLRRRKRRWSIHPRRGQRWEVCTRFSHLSNRKNSWESGSDVYTHQGMGCCSWGYVKLERNCAEEGGEADDVQFHPRRGRSWRMTWCDVSSFPARKSLWGSESDVYTHQGMGCCP